MRRVYLIEPVVAVYAFSMFMIYPVLQQYVYRRLWEELTGAPYPADLNQPCSDNKTNLTSIHKEVQKEASLFFLHSELCFLFPSLLSSLLLVSYSDHCGRKAAIVPPLVGDLFFALSYVIVSRFSLSLNYLLGASFLTGFLGGPTTLIGGCFAYVADRCEQGDGGGGRDPYEESDSGLGEGGDGGEERGGGVGRKDKGEGGDQCEERDGSVVCGGGGRDGSRDRVSSRGCGGRTVHMAVLDMILGVLSGLASFCTGFFIRAAGFTWPFLTAALLHLLNLGYVLCVLQESMVSHAHTPSSSSPSSSSPSTLSPTHIGLGSSYLPKREALIGRLQGVYLLFAASTRRRNAILGLLLTAYAFYKVSKLGGMSIFILYELNAPLCWSEVLVGYGSALSTVIYMGSFAGVSLLSRCLRDGYIVLLGLLSVSAGMMMAAFAKNTLLMFLVRLPLLLSIMPTPVLKSMMSKIVLSSEQGAVFACVAFVEMLSIGVALTIFSSTYAVTVSWFAGFSFLLASGLTLIPAALIGVVLCLRLDVDEETNRLTGGEEEDREAGRETLQLPAWDTN